jgi:hypothetical protein
VCTLPMKQTPAASATETIEERFRRLEATWQAEVGYSSSSTDLCNHPAFQELIAMGEAVVPLMLRDLSTRPRLWVWALPRITGEDPVPAADRGNIGKMSEAWLRWGREHGYEWVGRIEQVFPGLSGSGYQLTSPEDDHYNCIAWAAGDTGHWWWPDEPDRPDSAHWPVGVPRVETLDAFREAFVTPGYTVCEDEQPEPGYEKIALFARFGAPKHAARQLPTGRWTSKLGPMQDIEHALHDLSGQLYGSHC